MPHLAVVVPVLWDSDALRQLLAGIPSRPDVEIVVVDGGHDESLDALAAGRPDVHVIRSTPGRGVQLNAGAHAASSRTDRLLFLHADSRLPAGWAAALLTMPATSVGGWFRFALDDQAWQARVIEWLVQLRVRLFHLPYGDQGLFVRRDVFDRMGGFRDWRLMEDVDFARRLATMGPTTALPLRLRTSARRWRRDGWFSRSIRNLGLLALYFAGVDPARLARWYAAR